ncbi:hypothetical protein ACI3L3_16840 [Desulfobaculum sp. SPO524]|uniref:hypothetical protein n=1 Tax=Desulfobaculum sp. SPO524 TaxID=3378071 RepID=UPI0038533A73
MFLKEIVCCGSVVCKVSLSKAECGMLLNSFNEVLRGFHNVDFESVLGVSKACALGYDQGMLEGYESAIGENVEVELPYRGLAVLQKAMIAVLQDFGCFPGDYSSRLGTELDEYLSLLDGLNSMLEEGCRLMCEEVEFDFR